MAPSSRKKLCTVCLQSFPEDETFAHAGKVICTGCAARTGVPLPRSEPPGAASDTFNVAARFGAELFRCLADGDVAHFAELVLTQDECKLTFGAEAADHAALVRGRFERDFKSKRALYFKEGPFELVKFQLGPVEDQLKDAVRYGRTTLIFRAAKQERRLVLQRLYRVRGRFKLEFFE
jgi:hypothetical protein